MPSTAHSHLLLWRDSRSRPAHGLRARLRPWSAPESAPGRACLPARRSRAFWRLGT